MLGRPHVVINCRGKLVGRRVEAYWTVRRWRDRTRRLGIRGLSEWRPDPGGEWGVVDSPRIHRHPCGAASIARGLPLSRLRHRRRADEGWRGARQLRVNRPAAATTAAAAAPPPPCSWLAALAGPTRPRLPRIAVSSPSSRAARSLARTASAVALNAPP